MKHFKYALCGIKKTVREECSLRIHLCFAFYVILAGFVTVVSHNQWFILILCIAAVISLECINTAIERLCNVLHPRQSRAIGFVKDAAAGAVLVSAIASAVIGCLIFFNTERLNAAYAFITKWPIAAFLIILTLVPAIFFVRGNFKGENR